MAGAKSGKAPGKIFAPGGSEEFSSGGRDYFTDPLFHRDSTNVTNVGYAPLWSDPQLKKLIVDNPGSGRMPRGLGGQFSQDVVIDEIAHEHGLSLPNPFNVDTHSQAVHSVCC